MKFGILYNRNNLNIGDDIQAVATSYFLPQIDYFIDREQMQDFKTKDKKPVAVIMNAWYMWNKWNWPPSKYIYPLFVGFHYADHQLGYQPGSIIKYEMLTGRGGEYLKANGPIGCRDHFTEKNLKDIGIDAYFSGCITMTLPKRPKEDRGKYICVVDAGDEITARIKEQLRGTDIEVKVLTHNRPRNKNRTWEERKAFVEERLSIYQNAICVVTKRLHCALPCLAMEVPVLLARINKDETRFDPYLDYLYWTTPEDYLSGKCTYDVTDPPENKPDYKPVREALIEKCRAFVDEVKDDDRSLFDLKKYRATDKEILEWRIDTLKEILPRWEDTLDKQAHELSDLYLQHFMLFSKTDEFRNYDKDKQKRLLKYVKSKANYYKFVVNYYQIDMTVRQVLAENPDIGPLHLEDLRLRTICDEYAKLSKRNFYRKEKILNGIEEMTAGEQI